MVYYLLKITAELENLTNLQPQGGCDDPHFTYLFKLKCGSCGEVTQKESCLSLNEVNVGSGKGGDHHLVQKCKFCGREGNINMITGQGLPLIHSQSQNGRYSPIMKFDCRGYEPVDFVFGPGWKAVSIEGTTFEDIDLSEGEFAEYDEKGECPVMISNLKAKFEVSRN